MQNIIFDDFETEIQNQLSNSKFFVKIAVAWMNFNLYYGIFCNILDKNIKLNIIINDDIINTSINNILAIDKLIKKGANISFISMPGRQIMHHKFCIIDNNIAMLGSYNWSLNASKNFENLLITDDKLIIDKLSSEFEFVYNNRSTISDFQFFTKCEHCKQVSVYIGILKTPQYDHLSCEIEIYKLCGCGDAKFIESTFINNDFYLTLQATENKYDNIIESMLNYGYREENVGERYQFEINNIIQNYIGNEYKIHGLGQIVLDQLVSQEDYGEQCINIFWKSRFAAKYIANYYDISTFYWDNDF